MAKWFGKIGYEGTAEDPPGSGIWSVGIIEREYYGDILSSVRRLQNGSDVNDDVKLNNRLSIISDPYANENYLRIRYAEFFGIKCKVTSVTVEFPRLILELGGEYNGGQA